MSKIQAPGRRGCWGRRGLALASALAGLAVQADYVYIVSRPADEEPPSAAVSSAVSFETGTLSAYSAATGLEARYRTSGISDGMAVSNELILIIR